MKSTLSEKKYCFGCARWAGEVEHQYCRSVLVAQDPNYEKTLVCDRCGQKDSSLFQYEIPDGDIRVISHGGIRGSFEYEVRLGGKWITRKDETTPTRIRYDRYPDHYDPKDGYNAKTEEEYQKSFAQFNHCISWSMDEDIPEIIFDYFKSFVDPEVKCVKFEHSGEVLTDSWKSWPVFYSYNL